MGEQVGAGLKKKTSEELVHIETDTGSEFCRKQNGKR